MTARKLKMALVAYVALGLAGMLVASDQKVRLVLWAVLAGLALKTIAAYKLSLIPPPGSAEKHAAEESDQA